MRIHKITRRNFMKVAGVSALAMGLAACGGSSSSTAASTSTAASASTAAGGEVTGDKVVINIGHINDESDSWHQGALKFKEYCEANSNGTIEVDVFPNSQLGPEVDMIQGILSDSGTVDITFTGESMQTYQPDLGMIGMPYLIQSDEQMEKVLTGEVGQEFEGLMEACGMKCLGYFTRGPRYITSTKKITSVADCNNLVIRTPQSAMTVDDFQALGAKPTPMALSEVFTSLQQGTIEAQENPLAMIETQSFYEVCPYLILTAHLRAWVYIAMGLAQYNVDVTVGKGTGAMPAFAGKEEQYEEHPQCIRCGKCVGVCPMRLEPVFMYKYLMKGDVDTWQNTLHGMDCIECGACTYICPARLPLIHAFRMGKQKVNNARMAAKAKAEAEKAAAEKKEA